jgi:hypothetical protein
MEYTIGNLAILIAVGTGACAPTLPKSAPAVAPPLSVAALVRCPVGEVPFTPTRFAFEAAPEQEAVATVNGVRIARASLADVLGKGEPTARTSRELRDIHDALIDLIRPLLWQQELVRLGVPLCPSRAAAHYLDPISDAVISAAYLPLSYAEIAELQQSAESWSNSPLQRGLVVLEKGTEDVLSARARTLRALPDEHLLTLAQKRISESEGNVLNAAHFSGTPAYDILMSYQKGINVFDFDGQAYLLYVEEKESRPSAPSLDDYRRAAAVSSISEGLEPDKAFDEESPFVRAYNEVENVRLGKARRAYDLAFGRLLDDANVVFDDGSGVTWRHLKAASTQ